MLQILRRKAQSTFIQIIVVIIALVFIFWGVGTNMSGDRQAALNINGEEITFQEFQDAYDRAYQNLSNQFGGNVPKGFAESFGIKQQVINQLVQTTLLRQGAQEMGIHISGQEIGDFIKDMVQFQENGVFNMDKYTSVLAANRLAPTKFEHSMKFDRLAEVAAREIGNFSAVVTPTELQELYARMNEEINLNYVTFSPEDFQAEVVADDEQLAKWFDTVKDNYKTEPQLKLIYLPFLYEKIARKIDIDEDKLKQYYEENLSTYTTPEKRHARHILLKVAEDAADDIKASQLQKANDILAQARSGDDFAELAKKVSEGPSRDNGGDLGYFTRGQMVPAFNDAVFGMEKGQISDVVTIQFGYHIILLEDIQEEAAQTFDEVKEQVRKNLQLKEADSLAFQVANNAYEGIIGAGSLSKYREAHPETSVVETEFFNRDSAPAELKADNEFLNKAFDLNKGELSSLIKGNSGYIILYATDIKEPQIPELASIRDKVLSDFKKSKSEQLAENAAKEFLDKLAGGSSMTTLADEKGLELKESGMLSQNNQENEGDFPSSLIQDAFLLSPNAPLPEAPGKAGEDFYVYSYLERATPEMPENNEELEKYEENLLQFKQRQLLAAWIKNLQAKAEITQHQSLL
jgi:peptidyl-prolyl cis-trans isomerase D